MEPTPAQTTPRTARDFVRNCWPIVTGISLLLSGLIVIAATEQFRHTEKVGVFTTYRDWHVWDALSSPLVGLGVCITLYGVTTRFPRFYRR